MRILSCFLLQCILMVATLSATENFSEFQNRRKELVRRLPRGVVLLHARSDLFSRTQLSMSGFQQDPSFYYFTGLDQISSAILAIDGVTKESWLFVPTKLSGEAGQIHQSFVVQNSALELSRGLEHIVPWDKFIAYIDERIA